MAGQKSVINTTSKAVSSAHDFAITCPVLNKYRAVGFLLESYCRNGQLQPDFFTIFLVWEKTEKISYIAKAANWAALSSTNAGSICCNYSKSSVGDLFSTELLFCASEEGS